MLVCAGIRDVRLPWMTGTVTEVHHMIKPTKDLQWRRSSRCSSDACVEVAWTGDHVLLRDSKDLAKAPMEFTAAEWAAFVKGARGGEFDFA
jgi:hypothetical protein